MKASLPVGAWVAAIALSTSAKQYGLGNIFEKRLIEAYISENGSDPVTGEELTVEDLVELKSARVVRPRPPTQTSIPALLSTFQNEWDALALESFTLKQQLAQTRQELSTALYDYEGALRLIAKISKDRDEARDALSKVGVHGTRAGSNGDAMQVDSQGLPEEIVAKIEATQKKWVAFIVPSCGHITDFSRLSSGRRKRAVPKGWSTAKDIQEFEADQPSWNPPKTFSFSTCTALAESDSILYGGSDGTALIHSNDGSTADVIIDCGSGITDGVLWEDKAIVSLSNGSVNIYEDGKQIVSHSIHAGPATGLALHPCGDVLASVGSDKSYALYDLTKPSAGPLSRVFTDSGKSICPSAWRYISNRVQNLLAANSTLTDIYLPLVERTEKSRSSISRRERLLQAFKLKWLSRRYPSQKMDIGWHLHP